MKVIDKLNMDINGLIENGPINIVVFGDSVTHGALNGTNDFENAYWNVLKKKLNTLRDSIPVNVINSGIGGTTAAVGVKRLERDVLRYSPDLVVVCFGLNDVNHALEEYINSLEIIFSECKKRNIETIFLTPNMLNTYVAHDTAADLREYAEITAEYQNSGRMDEYINTAIKKANDMEVSVCDCYGEWKKMYNSGIDTTMLLINRINHPTSEMHKLFAQMLYDIIVGNEDGISTDYANTMYNK